jgi:mRNA-degrading endonuclease RelE of RelBE toxin-antitoxin system
MTVEWSPEAVRMASRFLDDKPGMTELVAAVDALADEPYPAEGFHRGDYHRLRAGPYRVVYTGAGDVITIDRVDRAG